MWAPLRVTRDIRLMSPGVEKRSPPPIIGMAQLFPKDGVVYLRCWMGNPMEGEKGESGLHSFHLTLAHDRRHSTGW